MMKRICWIFLAALVCVTFVFPSLELKGAEFRSSDSAGLASVDNTVESRNLFISGSDLNIQPKKIRFDLFAAGKNVTINTNVEQGSFVAGQKIDMKGRYGGNVFVAGYDIVIDAEIMGDVFIACNTWRILPDAKIHGDVHVAGTVGYFDGLIDGSLLGAGSEWYLNGKIGRIAKIEVAKSVTIGEKANINELQYTGYEEATIMEGATIGKTTFVSASKDEKTKTKKAPFRFSFINFLASILLGFVLVFVFKKPMEKTLSTIQHQFFASLGIGFAVLFAVPIAIILIFITFIGYKIALGLLIVYFLLLLLMSIVAGIWLGELLLKVFKMKTASPSWLGLIIGVLVMQFIPWIPYVGWIIILFLSIVSLGGVVVSVFQKPSVKESP